MGIIDREYITEGYSVHDKKNRDLSLLIANDGFSFAIFDDQHKLQALRIYRLTSDAKLEECLKTINQDKLLKSIFRNVNIALGGKPTALVPQKLFDQRFPEAYLGTDTLTVSKTVWIDEVATLQGKNVHAIETSLKDQLSDYFPGANFQHRTTVLIEYLGKSVKPSSQTTLFVHVDNQQAYTFLFDQGRLVQTGDFEFQAPSDFLYYSLLIYQNHNLDPEEVPLSISGQLDAKSQVCNQLYRYIRSIQWTAVYSGIEFGDYQGSHPMHYDFELFALHLCA